MDNFDIKLENATRRGDKFLDLYQQERKAFYQLQSAIDNLTNRLRDAHDESARLRCILLKLKHNFNMESEE